MKRAFVMALGGAGFAMVFYAAGWMTALGLYLALFANNIDQAGL